MMQKTREAIGPNKLMIANILRARFENGGLEYLDYFDGSYLEMFFHNVGKASYEEYVAKGIDAIQKAARQGKIIAFTSGLATPKNNSKMSTMQINTQTSGWFKKLFMTHPPLEERIAYLENLRIN